MTTVARHFVLVALILGLSVWLHPARLHAAQPAAIEATARHTYLFAQQITFILDATGDVPINRATVFFQSDQLPLQQLDAGFAPGTTIHLEVVHELRGGAIPPFSKVTYWWEIADEANQKLTTPRMAFDYVDNRFSWQRASDGGVTVYWVAGDAAFAEAVLDTALETLPGIAGEIGVSPPSTIEVYVYPSREDLIGALRLGGRDWAGGQARPELGVVVFDLPPTATAPVEMRRAIPHELTHLLVYAATQPNYDNVPAWLNEGLATANEASPDPEQAVALESALSAAGLLSFEFLCAPFPDDAGQALLAYAQSGDFVQFIRDRYGGEDIRSLLAVYRENAACLPGVERALNVTLSALERDWRARFASGGEVVAQVAETGAPWFVLLLIACLALLPMLLGVARPKPG